MASLRPPPAPFRGLGAASRTEQDRIGLRPMLIVAAFALGIVVAFSVVWLFSALPTLLPASRHTDAILMQESTLRSRTWDLEHLEADGLEKCRAYRRVVDDMQALQVLRHGNARDPTSLIHIVLSGGAAPVSPDAVTALRASSQSPEPPSSGQPR